MGCLRMATSMLDSRFIIPFAAAAETDHPRMGGKCASLAKMITLGAPVPPGFAVATDAYAANLKAYGLPDAIEAELATLDAAEVTDQETKSRVIRALVTGRAMPAEVEAAIRNAYAAMAPNDDAPVAVR